MLCQTGIGSLWELNEVTGPITSNCPYNGPRANAEYESITGCPVVPTEQDGNPGTRCGHWDEECMRSELMTGFLNGAGPHPLSRITIATLEDLGYTVDYSMAESYGTNDVNSACTCNGQRSLQLSAHQLGTSHQSTRRRSLSAEAHQMAMDYGQEILLQRPEGGDTTLPDGVVYVGDQMVVVFVEEKGAFFDVTVTL